LTNVSLGSTIERIISKIKRAKKPTKSIDDVKRAVSELCEFTELIGGDIARLGEERVVITPAFVKIWRERTSEGETPTAA